MLIYIDKYIFYTDCDTLWTSYRVIFLDCWYFFLMIPNFTRFQGLGMQEAMDHLFFLAGMVLCSKRKLRDFLTNGPFKFWISLKNPKTFPTLNFLPNCWDFWFVIFLVHNDIQTHDLQYGVSGLSSFNFIQL